jgi:hypothetical protein
LSIEGGDQLAALREESADTQFRPAYVDIDAVVLGQGLNRGELLFRAGLAFRYGARGALKAGIVYFAPGRHQSDENRIDGIGNVRCRAGKRLRHRFDLSYRVADLVDEKEPAAAGGRDQRRHDEKGQTQSPLQSQLVPPAPMRNRRHLKTPNDDFFSD